VQTACPFQTWLFLPKLEQKTVVGDDRHGNVTGKPILAAEIFDSNQNGTGIIGKQIQANKWLGCSLTSGVQQRDVIHDAVTG
jgi:hypothetical protein